MNTSKARDRIGAFNQTSTGSIPAARGVHDERTLEYYVTITFFYLLVEVSYYFSTRNIKIIWLYYFKGTKIVEYLLITHTSIGSGLLCVTNSFHIKVCW